MSHPAHTITLPRLLLLNSDSSVDDNASDTTSDSDSESDNASDSDSDSNSDGDSDIDADDDDNIYGDLNRNHACSNSHGDHTSPPISLQSATPLSQRSTASHVSRNPSTLNNYNLSCNQLSGDNLDDYPAPQDDFIRIYFQNVNSLRTLANGLDVLDFFCQMKDAGATIFGINEINQDTCHPYIHQFFHKHQHRVWDNSKLQYPSSKINIGRLRKPGGTLLGVTGSISSRVIDKFSDAM
jgi:hypothetical protein